MAKRKITIDDLLSVKWVSDPQISPDGTKVAYVLTTVNKETNTYGADLWIASLHGEPRQFTNGTHKDTSPRWSPDGRYIAFLSDRAVTGGDDKKKPKHIYLIPADGGEAVQLTSGNLRPAQLAWSPDGNGIAFIGKPEREQKDSSDVKVITRVRYKFDGEGPWDGRYKHLFVLSLDISPTGIKALPPRQLTNGDFDHANPAWSPDGRGIAFSSNRTPEGDFTNITDIHVIAAAGGEPRVLTKSIGPAAQPAWSPDGRRVAYYGHDNASMGATNTSLWIVSAEGGVPHNLTKSFDRHLGHHVISDMRAHPEVGGPVWSPDGGAIFTLIADGATNQLGVVAVSDGAVKEVTSARREVFGYSLDRACRIAVLAASDPLNPGDLLALELDAMTVRRERRITAVNQPLLDELTLSAPERFTYEGADGWAVDGWMMRPVEFAEGEKYPTVLQIHGGPHSAYGEAFFHEFQLLAAQGYALVYTNPRGSQGYGQRFTAATHHDWGGKDYEDIMRGLDAAVARYPFIDTERLGVAGGSYGGFMTNWIIGHTDRFKAAVTMRSICNHLSQWGTSDLAFMKGFWEFPGDPWETPTWYWEHSPLAYVEKVKTPLLILHSEQDLRCPIGEAEQLFAALKKLRREVVFVRFPDESHDLSRNGKPAHRAERLRWIVRWFGEHLLTPAATPVREAAVAGGSEA